jgi:hypothetical protein
MTAQVWLIRFSLSFALLWAVCWAVPRLFTDLPRFPAITTDEEQVEIFDRYFSQPPRDIVVVGSSLAYHLKERFFEHGNVRNLSIPGGSPLTGLAIIAAAPVARPRAIAVETNVLVRAIDDGLVARFRSARPHIAVLAPLRTLAAWYQGGQDDMLTYTRERVMAVVKSPPAPDRSAAAAEAIRAEWSQPVQREAMLRGAHMLTSLAEQLEAQGVKVFFFEMPYPSPLQHSVFATSTREVLAEAIGPDDKRWLTLHYPFDELRSADAAHLDDRSSVIFAAALGEAIEQRLGQDEKGEPSRRN